MNVLIIDDTPADHHLCVECLGECGHYHFIHAYSGEEGLRAYGEHSVDCILLDYNLPDMNGLEVLEKLGVMEKTIPVVMMTGEGSEVIAVTAMKLGSQDYIPKKMITSSALRRCIEHATQHLDLLRQMEKYRAELERSNHDLELFANIVAHDLKSPLRAITQHLTLIKGKCADSLDEKGLRSLEFAVDGAERMHALIEALFTYARLGFSEVEYTPVDMNTVFRNAERNLIASIEETRARVTCDHLPFVRGDIVLLTQLMQNLLENALKYCRSVPRIHVSAKRESGQWRISVCDNGIGIPDMQYEKIFTIFRRLHKKEEYSGIGLGLAVCARIINRQGGKIWVESEQGKGSIFHFTAPPAEENVQRKAGYG